MITLVCGLPGTGKTTWVKEHMNDGVAYDLDAIAGAFRLRGPHEEYHDASRHMANDILKAFSKNAGRYTPSVYVIRTAPDDDEIEIIKPGTCGDLHEAARQAGLFAGGRVQTAKAGGVVREHRDTAGVCV